MPDDNERLTPDNVYAELIRLLNRSMPIDVIDACAMCLLELAKNDRTRAFTHWNYVLAHTSFLMTKGGY